MIWRGDDLARRRSGFANLGVQPVVLKRPIVEKTHSMVVRADLEPPLPGD